MKNGSESHYPSAATDIEQSVFDDDTYVDRMIGNAVINAIREHKEAGNPIAVWRDGRVVIIPPDEIVIPEEEEAVTSAPDGTPPTDR